MYRNDDDNGRRRRRRRQRRHNRLAEISGAKAAVVARLYVHVVLWFGKKDKRFWLQAVYGHSVHTQAHTDTQSLSEIYSSAQSQIQPTIGMVHGKSALMLLHVPLSGVWLGLCVAISHHSHCTKVNWKNTRNDKDDSERNSNHKIHNDSINLFTYCWNCWCCSSFRLSPHLCCGRLRGTHKKRSFLFADEGSYIHSYIYNIDICIVCVRTVRTHCILYIHMRRLAVFQFLPSSFMHIVIVWFVTTTKYTHIITSQGISWTFSTSNEWCSHSVAKGFILLFSGHTIILWA